MPWLSDARRDFLHDCIKAGGAISQSPAGVMSIADSSSVRSMAIAADMMGRIGAVPIVPKKPPGQTSGERFEVAISNFLGHALAKLSHLRPGTFAAGRGRTIAEFDQFAHLNEIARLAATNRELQVHMGADYLIKPDVVVYREPIPDADFNQREALVDATIAKLSAARSRNDSRPTLIASVSCKLTIRSDRVQNTRSEALNLVRNRKGSLPRAVAVTAEPLPGRIKAIALGTGDLDCVYHFALDELLAALHHLGDRELDIVETMVEGHRLRDIADLPLDMIL